MPDEKQVNVEIQKSEAQLKKEEYIAARGEDAKKCTAEFTELLKKYNCFTEIDVTIGTSGKIRGQVTIHPRI